MARVPMKVETLAFAVDLMTWMFLDMANASGRIALMWGKTLVARRSQRGRKSNVARLDTGNRSAILLAYAVNELADDGRALLLTRLLAAHREWLAAFNGEGPREDEWRFRVSLPPRQRTLAQAAGLDPQELTARSLYVSRIQS
ncbi:MAG: hypothetical protein ABIP65_06020 [Vicinamibacterales bacterium]